MRCLAHNMIAHPIAGLLWWAAEKPRRSDIADRLRALGDRMHGLWAPDDEGRWL